MPRPELLASIRPVALPVVDVIARPYFDGDTQRQYALAPTEHESSVRGNTNRDLDLSFDSDRAQGTFQTNRYGPILANRPATSDYFGSVSRPSSGAATLMATPPHGNGFTTNSYDFLPRDDMDVSLQHVLYETQGMPPDRLMQLCLLTRIPH